MATHTVKNGESLSKIGAQYGIGWQAIASANNIASPYVIRPGQSLVIPNGSSITTNQGGGMLDTTGLVDKVIGGVLLYGIFRVLMKVF